MSTEHAIKELKAIAAEQLGLVNLTLEATVKGRVTLDDVVLACRLPDKSRNAAALLAMAAGQSTGTLLTMAASRGIPVRDMYPIARSVVEACVNACYLMAAAEDVADRAFRHVDFALMRNSNRTIGTGAFAMKVATDPVGTLERMFPEFADRSRREWTSLSVPDRIEKVGKLVSAKGASRLLAAYGLVYSISSEIIHGSLAGVTYFYSAHLRETSLEAFVEATGEQVFDLLIAVLHAVSGLLATYFDTHEFEAGQRREAKLFDRLFAVSQV